MKKKTKILAALLAVLVIICVCTIPPLAKGESIFAALGKLINAEKQSDDSVAVRVGEFEISSARLKRTILKRTIEEYKAAGIADGEAAERAANQLIRSWALYSLALKNGCEYSDEQAEADAENNRKALSAPEFAGQMAEFYKSTGMTEDEYWAQQTAVYKRYGSVAMHKNALYEQYLKDGSLKDTADARESFDAWYADFTEKAVREADVEIVDKALLPNYKIG